MAETSDESLSSAMALLPSGGSILRNACGSTMWYMVRGNDMPSEREASTWPRSIDWIPARKISEIYTLDNLQLLEVPRDSRDIYQFLYLNPNIVQSSDGDG